MISIGIWTGTKNSRQASSQTGGWDRCLPAAVLYFCFLPSINSLTISWMRSDRVSARLALSIHLMYVLR